MKSTINFIFEFDIGTGNIPSEESVDKRFKSSYKQERIKPKL